MGIYKKIPSIGTVMNPAIISPVKLASKDAPTGRSITEAEATVPTVTLETAVTDLKHNCPNCANKETNW